MAQREIPEKRKKVGMLDYVSYAAGDFGCNCSFALASSWLTLFYTQYMGIPTALYAVILAILKVWDGVNDPLIGGLIDSSRRQFKRGKFLTFIFWGSFGLVISGALCFLPVPGAPMAAKVILAVVGYMLWDACYTVVNVPYGSMLSTITSDPGARAQLGAFRSLGSLLASVPTGIIIPLIVYDADQNIMGDRLFILAIVLGIIGLVAFQFMVHTTIERVEIPDSVRAAKFNFFRAVKNFFGNRAAVGSTFATCMMLFAQLGATTATQVMWQSYYHNTAISGVVGLFMTIPMLLIMPFVRKITAKWGKKEASQRGILLSVIACALMIIPVPANWFGIATFAVLQALNGIGMSVIMAVGNAMMADAIDYGELKDGVREEGTIYAVQSTFRKIVQGLGPSLVLLVMVALGYDESLGSNQPTEVASNIRTLVGVVHFVGAFLMWVALKFVYPLTKEKTAEMQKALGRTDAV